MNSGLLLDRYILQESLGDGASAEVNLAWDTTMQRNVAIKRIPLPDVAVRANMPGLEEARTAAKLHDSRIVSVYDFAEGDNEALLIMEFVDGLSLGELMDRIPRRLSLDEIASIVQNVGKALQHAHSSKVLHLDVKPDNILIDTTGLSKVTDFGIGKLAQAGTFGAATGGTIGYMPPEQITGVEVTPKTDQWAFAVMVYELLVGENPFVCDNFDQSLALIQQAEIVLPSSVDEDIDPEVDDILFRAMDIDPDNRYPSVAKFVSALVPHLGTPKTGRARLAKLVDLLGDEIMLGSPEQRIAAMQAAAIGDASMQMPISDEDDEFYDVDSTAGDYYDDYADDEDTYAYGEYPEKDPYDQRITLDNKPREHHSIKNIVSNKAAAVIIRIVGAASSSVVAYLGTTSIAMPQWYLQWILVAAIAALGAVFPRYGALGALICLGVGMITSNWIAQGALLLSISALWWILCGRNDDVTANCGILGLALGPIGMALMQPMCAGKFLDFKSTILTALFGVGAMLVVFPITGGTDIYFSGISFLDHSTANDLAAESVYKQIWLWIAAAGWVLAAVAMNLFANRGRKTLSMLGVVLAGAIIIALRVAEGWVGGLIYGFYSAESVAALIIPVLAMLLVSWVYDPN